MDNHKSDLEMARDLFKRLGLEPREHTGDYNDGESGGFVRLGFESDDAKVWGDMGIRVEFAFTDDGRFLELGIFDKEEWKIAN